MSTDSTELTFIRCPSCRSLVPAVSTRCRMCGASLDAAATQAEGGENRAAGRVRQRTMSTTPQSEFGQAVDRLRDEVNTGSTEGAAGTEYDDPLALYSEDAEASAGETSGEVTSQDKAEAGADIDESDPLGDYLAEDEGSSAAAPNELDDDDEYDPFSDTDDEIDPVSADTKSNPPAEEVPAAVVTAATPQNGQADTSASKPRVIVESGSRRFGAGKGGLSFGAKPSNEERNLTGRSFDKPAAHEARSEEAPKVNKPQREVEEKKPFEARAESNRGESAKQSQKSRETHPEKRRESGVKPAESKTGRLVGWMVSYEDPDGKAIELREGRFFVTGSSLKPSDLVLSDPSVSTPHAMVKVTAQGELQIQDLMSDRGVFIREREGAAYQREAEEVSVRNGDWIRFGDVEFLVSLIAHVGEK